MFRLVKYVRRFPDAHSPNMESALETRYALPTVLNSAHTVDASLSNDTPKRAVLLGRRAYHQAVHTLQLRYLLCFSFALRATQATANTHLTVHHDCLLPVPTRSPLLLSARIRERGRGKSEAIENIQRPIRRQGIPFRKAERLGGEKGEEGRTTDDSVRYAGTRKGETTTQQQKKEENR